MADNKDFLKVTTDDSITVFGGTENETSLSAGDVLSIQKREYGNGDMTSFMHRANSDGEISLIAMGNGKDAYSDFQKAFNQIESRGDGIALDTSLSSPEMEAVDILRAGGHNSMTERGSDFSLKVKGVFEISGFGDESTVGLTITGEPNETFQLNKGDIVSVSERGFNDGTSQRIYSKIDAEGQISTLGFENSDTGFGASSELRELEKRNVTRQVGGEYPSIVKPEDVLVKKRVEANASRNEKNVSSPELEPLISVSQLRPKQYDADVYLREKGVGVDDMLILESKDIGNGRVEETLFKVDKDYNSSILDAYSGDIDNQHSLTSKVDKLANKDFFEVTSLYEGKDNGLSIEEKTKSGIEFLNKGEKEEKTNKKSKGMSLSM